MNIHIIAGLVLVAAGCFNIYIGGKNEGRVESKKLVDTALKQIDDANQTSDKAIALVKEVGEQRDRLIKLVEDMQSAR